MSGYDFERSYYVCQPNTLAVSNDTVRIQEQYAKQQKEIKIFESFQESHLNMNVIDSEKELQQAKRSGYNWAYIGMTISDFLGNVKQQNKVNQALSEARRLKGRVQEPPSEITVRYIGDRNFQNEIKASENRIIQYFNELHNNVYTDKSKSEIQRDLYWEAQYLAQIKKDYQEHKLILAKK